MYSHAFHSGWVIPYCIPFNHKNGIVCVCSKFFATEYTFRDHVKNFPKECIEIGTKPTMTSCVELPFCDPTIPQIQYKSEEYDQLFLQPQWIKNGHGRFCLRLHPDATTVACICGQYMSIHRIRTDHWMKCPLMKKLTSPKHTISSLVASPGSPYLEIYTSLNRVKKRITYSGVANKIPYTDFYTCYKPYDDNGATFWVPSHMCKNDLPKAVKRHMHHLDYTISLHWEQLTELLQNYSCNEAKEISCQRYRIQLDFGRNVGHHWLSLCDTFGFDNYGVVAILDFARKHTAFDLGEETYSKGHVHSPCIKMCKTDTQEPFKASPFPRSHHRQYSMVLNSSGSTVMVVKPKHDSRVIDFSHLADLLMEGTRLADDDGSYWMRPSQNLLKKIISLSGSVDSDGVVPSLNCELFGICHLDTPTSDSQTTEMGKDLFDWTSHRLRSVPFGTIQSFDSSVLHADSGAEHKDVRVVLTWEWQLGESEPPPSKHKHWTKTMTMAAIAETMWHVLTTEEKKEMVLLVFYCHVTEHGCDIVHSGSVLLGEIVKFPPLSQPNSKQIILDTISNLVHQDNIF